MASVRLNGKHQCSATVISTTHLICCALCVYILKSFEPVYENITVTVGSNYLDVINGNLYGIAHIDIPVYYKPNKFSYSPNDVSIITVSSQYLYRNG